MININKQTECCGCSACAEVCPKKCIFLEPDNEGYWYPKVNQNLCIDCGLCEKVCPVLNPQLERTPLHVYAAMHKDNEIRAKSASGGMFSLIAQKVIQEGGIVFGVKFDKEWNVVFGHTDSLEGLEAFRRSKYVQAWVGDSYKKVQEYLKQDKKVLFSGTPCQIAGLHSFLRKEYKNLITVDIICEGVPSPKLWKRYLKEEIAQNTQKIQSQLPADSENYIHITDISFRNKQKGWKNYSFALSFSVTQKNDKKNTILPITIIEHNSAFLQLLFNAVNLRPICYECPFKKCKSQSDITIADYWGIDKLHPEMDDDKGTSMVFINTLKGKTYFDLSETHYLETTYTETWPYNNVVISPKKRILRDYLYKKIDYRKDAIKFMNRILFFSILYEKRYFYLKIIPRKIMGERAWRKLKIYKNRIKNHKSSIF